MVKNSNHWDKDAAQGAYKGATMGSQRQPHIFSLFVSNKAKVDPRTHLAQHRPEISSFISVFFFFNSGKDFLPGFGQLKCQQTSADEGREGQEDGDDLSDADEGREDEAGDDGRKFTDPIQDTECCSSAVPKDTELHVIS